MGLNTCKLSTFVCVVEKYIAPSMLFVSCFHLIQRNNSTYQNSKYNSKNCENVKKFYYLFYSIIVYNSPIFSSFNFASISSSFNRKYIAFITFRIFSDTQVSSKWIFFAFYRKISFLIHNQFDFLQCVAFI